MEQTSKKTIVSLKDIFIKFDGEVILNHINLDINEKEFVTILGPSGCGKTTTQAATPAFSHVPTALSSSTRRDTRSASATSARATATASRHA